MSRRETAHVFDGPGEPLVGVLSHPESPARTAVLIIVGGPQYRVGSHRQFVALAHRVADAGHAALRFDYRGMGDSGGAMRSFETVSDDVGAAIDFMLRELPGLRQVVLWGLCDGASAALLYCQQRRDARVAGLCLVNPWARSPQSLARAHVKHYYLQRLREPAFWRKLWSGGVAWTAVHSLLGNLRVARAPVARGADQLPYQARMAQAWHDASRPILLLLSGRDYTAKEFIETVAVDPTWVGAFDRPGLTRHTLVEADHTFSDSRHQREVEMLTCDWLQTLAAETPAGEAA